MENTLQTITKILEHLFKAEHRRLEAGLVAMHRSNREIWGKPADGFIYRGEFYLPAGTPKGKRTCIPIHERLEGEMKEYLFDRTTIGEDSGRIHQLLYKLLEPCGYTGHFDQDIRDAVPECIQDVLPDYIRSMERMRPCEQMLRNPRDIEFYNEVLPRIEFYSVARLMY